jgi:hypothetical protein
MPRSVLNKPGNLIHRSIKLKEDVTYIRDWITQKTLVLLIPELFNFTMGHFLSLIRNSLAQGNLASFGNFTCLTNSGQSRSSLLCATDKPCKHMRIHSSGKMFPFEKYNVPLPRQAQVPATREELYYQFSSVPMWLFTGHR